MKKVTKAIAAIMLMTAAVFAAGCTKEEPSSGSHNGHAYVDLGLPSGTLWATSNLEAGNSKGHAHFAWGETQTKTSYINETYKFYETYPNIVAGHIVGYLSRMSKYCSNDQLTVLEAEDDAATVFWGEGWHIPTVEEWKELYDNCTFTYIEPDKNNKSRREGALFTAPNGNTLFLPVAVNYETYISPVEEEDLFGCAYWTSSVYPKGQWNHAQFTSISSFGAKISNEYRWLGLEIRPVYSLE